MKIVSWNVSAYNSSRKINLGIDKIRSFNPDIICLQEVPGKILRSLYEKNYQISRTGDFIDKKQRGKNYHVTLSKTEIISSSAITYYQDPTISIWNKWIYNKLLSKVELHNALLTTIQYKGKSVSIINTRLSAVIPPHRRLEQLKNLFNLSIKQKENIDTIICGDFNITDNDIFNIFTGWARGYKLIDYFSFDEREKANQLIKSMKLSNPFDQKITSILPLKGMQLDHILVPNSYEIIRNKLCKKAFSSDHKILLLETKD